MSGAVLVVRRSSGCYAVFAGGTFLELFDYWRNAMRFAKALNRGPVRYVR